MYLQQMCPWHLVRVEFNIFHNLIKHIDNSSKPLKKKKKKSSMQWHMDRFFLDQRVFILFTSCIMYLICTGLSDFIFLP